MKTIKIANTMGAKGIARRIRNALRHDSPERIVIVCDWPGGPVSDLASLIANVPPAVAVTC